MLIELLQQAFLIMSSNFLIQIGYLSSENNRSCRRRKVVTEHVGPVYGEIVPRITQHEADKIRLRYEKPRWSQCLAEKKTKRKPSIPGRRRKVSQQETTETCEKDITIPSTAIRVSYSKNYSKCGCWKLFLSFIRKDRR